MNNILDPLGLNTEQELLAKDAAESMGIAQAFAQCFLSDSGKKVLEYLRSKTIDQPTWVPELGEKHGYAREGQNSIYREITRQIEYATKPE
ncbi:MAG: hypothetical protein HGA59_09570 [Chlorobiaceae bacterium]|nr:hypothetical protein [Chlorobiaceae bacterium]